MRPCRESLAPSSIVVPNNVGAFFSFFEKHRPVLSLDLPWSWIMMEEFERRDSSLDGYLLLCMCVWVCGCVGVWVWVCVCVWVRGCVGVWVCGCVGVWVCGCVGLFRSLSLSLSVFPSLSNGGRREGAGAEQGYLLSLSLCLSLSLSLCRSHSLILSLSPSLSLSPYFSMVGTVGEERVRAQRRSARTLEWTPATLSCSSRHSLRNARVHEPSIRARVRERESERT